MVQPMGGQGTMEKKNPKAGGAALSRPTCQLLPFTGSTGVSPLQEGEHFSARKTRPAGKFGGRRPPCITTT